MEKTAYLGLHCTLFGMSFLCVKGVKQFKFLKHPNNGIYNANLSWNAFAHSTITKASIKLNSYVQLCKCNFMQIVHSSTDAEANEVKFEQFGIN